MMQYSIGDISRKTGLTVSTLRYYEKLGVLSAVPRSQGNIRQYGPQELERLQLLECLKNTGMSLKDIRTFFAWCDQGDSTLQNRLDLILARKREVESQISQLRGYLNKLEQKIDHYRQALNASHPA